MIQLTEQKKIEHFYAAKNYRQEQKNMLGQCEVIDDGKVISKLLYWLSWACQGFPKRYGKGKAFVIIK